MSEKKYLSGVFASAAHERAPDFVVCNVSINVKMLGHALQEYKNEEWVNLQVKKPYEIDPNKPRKLNVVIDDYKQEKKSQSKTEDFDDDIPF
jgi:hypothetical protein